MSNHTQSIGQNLKQLRIASGLTQSEVGQAIGVSYQQIQKYEVGGNRLTAEKLYKLKVFYDVPYEAFFKGAGGGRTESLYEKQNARLFAKLSGLKDYRLKQKLEQVLSIFLEE